MTSVCIASAAWRRLDVTRLVLKQRQRLCVELAARGIDAVSLIAANDENLELASEYGCETVEAKNDPLGRKCNLLLKRAAELADWIVWVGSDDWIHPDVFEPLDGRDRPPTIIHGSRLAIVDLQTGQLQTISSPSQYGAIPWLIDSRMIAGKTGDPIRPDLPRGLDGALIRGLRRMHRPLVFEQHDPHQFRCVDFKSRSNLTPYSGLAKNLGLGEPGTAWDELAGWFPADLIAEVRDLAERI